VRSRGSVQDTVPYLMQALRQGFQVRPPHKKIWCYRMIWGRLKI